ncbi:MAG: DASH family cryptochrome [Bacteroidia bacterium]|nr:DASH family cryptochrome [Bacteroidia bacterium]
MKNIKSIVWFRQDLRLHDNEALTDALAASDVVIPVYIFDERKFRGTTSRFGFPKIGVHRAKFIIESINNLRLSFQARGSDLIVRIGRPEQIIAELAREQRVQWVFCNRERTREEVDVQDALEQKLWTTGQELRFSRGKMLYHTADLPFPITHTPDIFSQFRKEVEKIVSIRPPLPTPQVQCCNIPADIDIGEIPTLETFGLEEPDRHERQLYEFRGGETHALERLEQFIWEKRAIAHYKQTKDELLGEDYSSKFSPWLAQGCLSPKLVYHEIKKYESENEFGESTSEMIIELMWRDFHRLMLKKHGDCIFQKGGIKNKIRMDLVEDGDILRIWVEGRTGIPFIDANMKELSATGFMSSRGRKNVASFLINDLKLSWQMGAEYFESMLLDYDPCSNYGNWNYIAGIGSDPRVFRNFNIIAQAKKYDPNGTYIQHWIPELAMLSKDVIHDPESMDSELAMSMGYHHGASYPRPMIDTNKWG